MVLSYVWQIELPFAEYRRVDIKMFVGARGRISKVSFWRWCSRGFEEKLEDLAKHFTSLTHFNFAVFWRFLVGGQIKVIFSLLCSAASQKIAPSYLCGGGRAPQCWSTGGGEAWGGIVTQRKMLNLIFGWLLGRIILLGSPCAAYLSGIGGCLLVVVVSLILNLAMVVLGSWAWQYY